MAAGDQPLDLFRIRAVGGRTFHRIQDPQPSGSTAAHVEQPAAPAQPVRHQVHRQGNGRQDLFHCIGHLVVFPVDDFHHFLCRYFINGHGSGIPLFRRKPVQIDHCKDTSSPVL